LSYGPQEFQAATNVSRETLDAFVVWHDLLLEANKSTNLVGRSTMDDFWRRHALDGFQLINHAPQNGLRWLDFGAGAGIPGLAIALAMKDRGLTNSRLVMAESVGKKARFVQTTIAATAAPASMDNCRVEVMDRTHKFDVITARAVASLDKLLWYSFPLLKTDGICLFPKGERYRQELTDANKYWTFDVDVRPSLTSEEGVILHLASVRPRKGNRHA